MTPNGIWFLCFIVVFGIPFSCIRTQNARLIALALVNGITLSALFLPVPQIAVVLAFTLCGYGLVRLISPERSKLILFLGIAAIVVLFVYLKKYLVIPREYTLSFDYTTIGMSYILFRIIHIYVDLYGRAIEKPVTFIEYISYTLFFANFSSGPIQRFQDFFKQSNTPLPLDGAAIRYALSRISTGYLKIIVVAPIALYAFQYVNDVSSYEGKGYLINLIPHIFQNFFKNSSGGNFLRYYLCLLILVPMYFIYLYVNFSGYMDVVIGAGRLIGFAVPENFDHPLKSKNFLDFWSRWHITLSQWIKFYIFNPLLKFLMTNVRSAALAPWLAVVSFFVTFLILGLWHGTTGAFLVYGLILGFGVSGNKIYQLVMQKAAGREFYKSLCRNKVYAHLCRSLTLAYFSLSIICLWQTTEQLTHTYALVEGKGLFLVLASLAGGACLVLPGVDFAAKISGWRPLKFESAARAGLASDLWVSLKLIAVVYATIYQFTRVPTFVYAAF